MIRPRILKLQIGLVFAAATLLVGGAKTAAQSTSLDYPTPITGDQLSGVVQARDIGDSRLTRHFYVLSGTTGDLTIAVQYANLNGDIDLFTLDGMRPLAKIGLVANDNTIKVERTVFIRIQEKLILRVEAKSANDDPGRYQIHFSGTFVAIADATEAPAPPTVEAKTTSTNRRRVTTAGEVIIEPEPEPVAKVEPPPKPVPAAAPPAKPRTRPGRGTATPSARSAPNPTGSDTGTAGTARNTRTGRTKTPSTAGTKPPADNNSTNPAPTTTTARPAPRRPTNRSTARTTPSTATPATPAPEPDPMANARLVVETRDGSLHEHYMRDVRRFTVEKGILLVIMKDGKTERQPMSNVLRVVIEP
jgi:hypothetical protein